VHLKKVDAPCYHATATMPQLEILFNIIHNRNITFFFSLFDATATMHHATMHHATNQIAFRTVKEQIAYI
jgi:hypothetical protein